MVGYHFGYSGSPGRRGKRLRPLLLLRVALAEGADVEAALDAAIAIELLHNYSLVHDDIEDNDSLRHGRETLWARFGIAHGINAGDAMCSLSFLTLLRSPAQRAERLAPMVAALHAAHLSMCEGQSLDIAFESRDFVTMDEYRTMIGGKTAALFSACCEIGALCAGSDPARGRAYASLGRAYGIAFQIRDDALGAWGATDVTGKPSGADIARRKWSFPVVWALSGRPCGDRAVVADAYARKEPLAPAEVAAVVRALERLGARDAADAECDRALEEATEIAHAAALDRDGSIQHFLAQGARRVA
jgi:geranylgeranyl diphosphate synthase, type I